MATATGSSLQVIACCPLTEKYEKVVRVCFSIIQLTAFLEDGFGFELLMINCQ